MSESVSVPRGRHAPPLEVRLEVQRRRLLDAAAAVFARLGYAKASAEAIAREAGMSKATFYEHFSNKEDAMAGVFDDAGQRVLGELVTAAREAGSDFRDRHRAGIRAFLEACEREPLYAQAILLESAGAGPRLVEKRDGMLEAIATAMHDETKAGAQRSRDTPVFLTVEDAFACVGAIFELGSRQIRLGRPASMADLEPVVERLILGMLSPARA